MTAEKPVFDRTISVNLFLDKYQKFEDWFLEFSKECENVSHENEDEFLKMAFPKAQEYFYAKIEEFGEDCLQFSKDEKAKIKSFIAKSEFIKATKVSPYFKQSIEHPRGYPGDAEMMSVIYRNEFEGDSVFGKIMNKVGTESQAGVAIRNRKKLITNEILKMKSGRVLSLAAGPAEELFDFLKKYPKANHQFKALDHDIQTLRDAEKRNKFSNLEYSIANAFHLIKGSRRIITPRSIFLNFCEPKKDIKGLRKLLLPIKYRFETLKLHQFDFIYSIGLYDYIQTFDSAEKGTKALTSELFKLLKPGGLLMIGNVSPKMPIGIIWAMEYLCNWKLIYRTREEIIAFCEGIPEPEIKDVELVMEPAGVNYFIKIRKVG